MTTGFDPYQPNIWVTPNQERASVLIRGVLVPTGTYTVERSTDGRSWTVIRSGTGTITTGQFNTEDTEPPLGVDLLYKVTIDQDTPDVIERNSVTTPRLGRGIGSWVVASPRVGTIVTDAAMYGEKVLQVSADAAGSSVWTVVRTNLATNPQDRTGGAAGWTTTRGFGAGGAGTYTHSQAVTGPLASPTTWTACRKTWTSPPSSPANAGFQLQKDATNWFGVTAGQVITVSAYLRHSATSLKTLVPRVQFYDRVAVSGAVAVGSTTAGTSVVAPANSTSWVRVSQTITVPAGALGLQVFMDTANVGDTPWVAGNTFDCTGLLVEVAPAATGYFDGTSTDVASSAQYDWAGTAWNSNSTASALHLAGRQKIATVGLGGTLAVGSYHVSGQIKYYDPNVMRWQELRDGPPPRTWANVKAIGSWGTVRGSASSSVEIPYGEVQVSIVNGSGTVVAGPIVAIAPSINLSQQWIEFNLDLTLTAALTGGRVVVSHGNNNREYTATWWLTRFIVLPTTQVEEPYLHFFDGDSTPPAHAEDYEWENGIFDSTQSGTISWEGTAGNSTSKFVTPDVVYTYAATRVDPPDSAPACDPVHLNLPIQPSMGQWFGLIKVSTLAHPGRTAVMEVIRRRPAIVVSDSRGWERGQLTLLTRTLEERRMAVGIFATGQVVQFRNPNPQYPEGSEGGPWYLGVTDVNEERPFNDHRKPERYWSVSFIRVEKPVGLIDATANTGSSWQHTKDTPPGATWQVVKDTYANWADVLYRDVAPTDPGAQFAGAGTGLPTEQANDAWQQEVLPV